MSDLVERLRYTAGIRERHRVDSDRDPIRLECLEAAARIEVLEAENARLREALEGIIEHCDNDGAGNEIVDDRIAYRCDQTARAALEDKA